MDDTMQQLLTAVLQNNLTLVRNLINSHKLDVNTPYADQDNKPVLHAAAAHGHLDMVKLLVEEYHANVNNESLGGEVAMHDAAENNHVHVVRYLADNGSHYVDDVEDMLLPSQLKNGWQLSFQ